MISAQFAISKARRDLTLGAIVRWSLIVTAIVALVAQPILDETGLTGVGVLMVVGAAWMVLSFRSVRGSRMAADSSSLIAAGQFELAERYLAEALGSFSIFRTAKLMSLHHLALLRHAQNRWSESAMLCQALLAQRLGAVGGMDRSSRLILAESLLELGDLGGVYENIERLYNQRLSLREAMGLLAVQTDYSARVGAWESLFGDVTAKVALAELMPTLPAARTQAFLALAAKKTGRPRWCDWLRRRVELLMDAQKLCAQRPVLAELWELPNAGGRLPNELPRA